MTGTELMGIAVLAMLAAAVFVLVVVALSEAGIVGLAVAVFVVFALLWPK